jgi:hypothetical protein
MPLGAQISAIMMFAIRSLESMRDTEGTNAAASMAAKASHANPLRHGRIVNMAAF